MAKTANIIEIEFDGPRNENPVFRPLDRKCRGRFILARVPNPNAQTLTKKYGAPIPGERLSLDLDTGEACIIEPLQLPEHEELRNKLARDETGRTIFRFGPARDSKGVVHKPTYLFWMRQVVEAGYARLTAGEFPRDLGGKPRTNFRSNETVSRDDRMMQILEQNTAAIRALLERLTK